MSIGIIARQDERQAPVDQAALLREALGQIKGTGRTAQSLRAGLYENAMRNGMSGAEMAQRGQIEQARLQQENALTQQKLAQKQDMFDQELGLQREKTTTEAISGLRGGLGRPVTRTTAPTPAQPLLRTGTSSWGDGTMGVDEDDPLAMKNGGVIGNVKKDTGDDQVPVVAREGEYFLNPETVAHIGGGDYKQGLRSLNALVREATGKEPGPSPVGKSGLRGFNKGGFVDDFGDVTLGNKKLSFAAQQAVSEAATSPQGKRVIANQFAAPQAEAVAQAAKQARVQDISAQVREATGRRTPIDELLNPKSRGVQAAETLAEPKAGLAQGAKNLGTKALKFLSSPGVVGLQMLTHSANAGDPNEDAWAARQREQWVNRELKPGEEPWNNPVSYGADILKAPEKAPATRGQGDEYTNSPERQAWLAEIAANGNTAPDAVAAFRTRNAAADVYRGEWQRQSPGGLRNADPRALDTYNAEQQVRGTGISARRQANGVMEFSGSGPAPQAQYIDANGNPTNEWRDTSEYRSAIARQIASGDENLRRRGLAAAMDVAQLDSSRSGGSVTGNPVVDSYLARGLELDDAVKLARLDGQSGSRGGAKVSTADQKYFAELAAGDDAQALSQASARNRSSGANRMAAAGVDPEVTAEYASAPFTRDELVRNQEILGVKQALANRQGAGWSDAVEGAGLGAVGAAGLALGGRLLASRFPGVKPAVDLLASRFGPRMGALVGGTFGGVRGAERNVQGDVADMEPNEFQMIFKNGVPEKAVQFNRDTGEVIIQRDKGKAPVTFTLESLQQQGLLADFAAALPLIGGLAKNRDFGEHVRILQSLDSAPPR